MPEITTDTSLARIQTDPVGDNPQATAFFNSTTTIDGVVYAAPWTSASWPILATDKTVTVYGLTLTYAQVSALIVAIAYQEKAAAEAVA